jgi:hypothetical protein
MAKPILRWLTDCRDQTATLNKDEVLCSFLVLGKSTRRKRWPRRRVVQHAERGIAAAIAASASNSE